MRKRKKKMTETHFACEYSLCSFQHLMKHVVSIIFKLHKITIQKYAKTCNEVSWNEIHANRTAFNRKWKEKKRSRSKIKQRTARAQLHSWRKWLCEQFSQIKGNKNAKRRMCCAFKLKQKWMTKKKNRVKIVNGEEGKNGWHANNKYFFSIFHRFYFFKWNVLATRSVNKILNSSFNFVSIQLVRMNIFFCVCIDFIVPINWIARVFVCSLNWYFQSVQWHFCECGQSICKLDRSLFCIVNGAQTFFFSNEVSLSRFCVFFYCSFRIMVICFFFLKGHFHLDSKLIMANIIDVKTCQHFDINEPINCKQECGREKRIKLPSAIIPFDSHSSNYTALPFQLSVFNKVIWNL